MKAFYSHLLIITLVLLGLPGSSMAGTRKVCPDGKVRYTACPAAGTPSIYGKKAGTELTRGIGNRLKLITRGAGPLIKGERYVRVFNESFTKLSKSAGLWKGKIKGNGQVFLTLAIIKNGQVVNKRHIGSVLVADHEDPTRFNFKSPLPAITDWSWKIIPRVL